MRQREDPGKNAQREKTLSARVGEEGRSPCPDAATVEGGNEIEYPGEDRQDVGKDKLLRVLHLIS